jgi:hypothetical protein
MIDAEPSLRAAEDLPASVLVHYLRSAGWNSRPSRVPGVTVLSKELPGADQPIHVVLPEIQGFSDEHRRVADALRTIEVVEERPMLAIVDDARQMWAASVEAAAIASAEAAADFVWHDDLPPKNR